jgi:hypothetical protein
LTRQFSAIAASVANSTAFLFRTGKAPGKPRQTGQTFVFGGSPKRVEQEQKILVAVSSWTCTSSPITGSNFVPATTEVSGMLAISSDYKAAWVRGNGSCPRACLRALLNKYTKITMWTTIMAGTFSTAR